MRGSSPVFGLLNLVSFVCESFCRETTSVGCHFLDLPDCLLAKRFPRPDNGDRGHAGLDGFPSQALTSRASIPGLN